MESYRLYGIKGVDSSSFARILLGVVVGVGGVAVALVASARIGQCGVGAAGDALTQVGSYVVLLAVFLLVARAMAWVLPTRKRWPIVFADGKVHFDGQVFDNRGLTDERLSGDYLRFCDAQGQQRRVLRTVQMTESQAPDEVRWGVLVLVDGQLTVQPMGNG